MEIYIKNWKVRRDEETKEYQIILYDFGITISSNNLEKNRLLWHSRFETNDIDIL